MPTLKTRILTLLRSGSPMTDDQMADFLKASPSSVRTRRFELEQEKLVEACGIAITKYGRETLVWTVPGHRWWAHAHRK